ncbi:hypothetical protein DA075_11435 [Methylobacterium currus]|uniref:Uncharacterized protein n=1 Tax=Methylobacterium currus TaxID=2051553 RepID=A0A2R4WIV5_9HYPH|nr:hypothetical protein [Methylobacterium currus]AWB21455.1 hypothetical protein DA075_11435 [Methylobacterium currus]UHC13783.1 hypothetical protein LRS73_14380 [Methylobacterium currus]
MPRPYEAVADAVRIARAIVMQEGSAVAAAARAGNDAALDAASCDLVSRIAQAILDAEHDAMARALVAADSHPMRRLSA